MAPRMRSTCATQHASSSRLAKSSRASSYLAWRGGGRRPGTRCRFTWAEVLQVSRPTLALHLVDHIDASNLSEGELARLSEALQH
eukprot:6423505-Alexandrium_andersonii.AAC.1